MVRVGDKVRVCLQFSVRYSVVKNYNNLHGVMEYVSRFTNALC